MFNFQMLLHRTFRSKAKKRKFKIKAKKFKYNLRVFLYSLNIFFKNYPYDF